MHISFKIFWMVSLQMVSLDHLLWNPMGCLFKKQIPKPYPHLVLLNQKLGGKFLRFDIFINRPGEKCFGDIPKVGELFLSLSYNLWPWGLSKAKFITERLVWRATLMSIVLEGFHVTPHMLSDVPEQLISCPSAEEGMNSRRSGEFRVTYLLTAHTRK